MKITKDNNVLIETTNTVNGMLEQGGVCGQVMAYPLDDVVQATGLTRDEIAEADPDDAAPGYEAASIRQVCEHHVKGRVVRRGTRIQ